MTLPSEPRTTSPNVASVASRANSLCPFSEVAHRLTAGRVGAFPLRRLESCSSRCPRSPTRTRSSSTCSSAGSARARSQQLRARNRGGPKWSFIDGPVTANKKLAVHTAWGRTLKDVFQRYKALKGFDQRYQNGFDCQGLWIEVGVERQLGFNSKREIEEFGLEEFAARCREVVVRSSRGAHPRLDPARTVDGLGERLLHVLRHEHRIHLAVPEDRPRARLALHRAPCDGLVPALRDLALPARADAVGRLPGEERPLALRPLPASRPQGRVGRRLDDDALDAAGERRRRRPSGRRVRAARERRVGSRLALPRRPLGAPGARARSSSVSDTQGRSTTSRPGASVEHRVVPWEEVSLEEGTGIVHIATGCGGEDFELGRSLGLDVLTPVDEAGRFYDDYGWLHGLSTVEAADQIVGDLSERGFLVGAGTYLHNYAHCWRCDTPIIFRISDDWFIGVDGIRAKLLEENAKVEWVPDYMGKRMDDWLRNMGDWNISRRRYYGLPLPFYPCECGHLNVVGSRAELEERALEGLDGLQELRRPWIDRVPISCEACGETVTRVLEVGDVWLDAGIVPFSTLGWQNPEWEHEGYATGAAAGLTKADLPDHAYWEKWFPADWVSEMREQIRLWFYSQFFMSCRARRPVAVHAGAGLREDARRARPRDARLVGEHDRRRGRVRANGRRRDALAVLRPASRPQPALRLRAGARDQAQAADALELDLVLRRLREHLRLRADTG